MTIMCNCKKCREDEREKNIEIIENKIKGLKKYAGSKGILLELKNELKGGLKMNEYTRCPKCEQKTGYLRKTTNDYRCGNCGAEFSLDNPCDCEEKKIERDKEPSVETIEMSKEEAQKEWEEYRKVLKDRKEKYVEDMYTCLSQMRRGRKVIDIFEIMKQAGLNEKEQPKLAIVKASAGTVYFFKKEKGAGKFTENSYRHNSHKTDLWLPQNTFPEFKLDEGESSIEWASPLRTKVPIVPPQFLPKGSLDNYYLLWEVEDWEIMPKDPLLLKRITKNLFAVLGCWDLTPLEQSIMRTK